ncbi:hypothetical protein [Mesorhizobium sp. M0243]
MNISKLLSVAIAFLYLCLVLGIDTKLLAALISLLKALTDLRR